LYITSEIRISQYCYSMIGYWHHDIVCLSVRPSVCNAVYCGVQGGCRELYRRAPSSAVYLHEVRVTSATSSTRLLLCSYKSAVRFCSYTI